MNKNTTNEKTVSPVIDRIKIAIDMHLKNYCFVRQQDYSAPELPQKLSPEAFLAWLGKQLKLAREVVVCYEAGCFGGHCPQTPAARRRGGAGGTVR